MGGASAGVQMATHSERRWFRRASAFSPLSSRKHVQHRGHLPANPPQVMPYESLAKANRVGRPHNRSVLANQLRQIRRSQRLALRDLRKFKEHHPKRFAYPTVSRTTFEKLTERSAFFVSGIATLLRCAGKLTSSSEWGHRCASQSNRMAQ